MKILEPHHDGSELYVSNSAPKIGDSIEIRVRVPVKDKCTRISRKGTTASIDLTAYGYTVKETLYGPSQSGGTIRIRSKSAISGIWLLK